MVMKLDTKISLVPIQSILFATQHSFVKKPLISKTNRLTSIHIGIAYFSQFSLLTFTLLLHYNKTLLLNFVRQD